MYNMYVYILGSPGMARLTWIRRPPRRLVCFVPKAIKKIEMFRPCFKWFMLKSEGSTMSKT